MSSFSLDHLERPCAEFPRRFVARKIDASDWNALRPFYEDLVERVLSGEEELRRWIADWSELDAVVREENSRLYIAMTTDTGNKEAAEAYSRFVETVEPELAPVEDKLNHRLVEHPLVGRLEEEFGVWLKGIRTEIELYRDENVPVETEIALEVQRYQQLTGSQSVVFDGEKKTLLQMAALQEEADRNLRERAWKAVAERRLQDRDALDAHYDKLLQLRLKVARQSDCPDYLDYVFKAKCRFDYTPADCRAFHDAVAERAVPLWREALKRRAEKMGLKRLRPWDLACDPLGRPKLAPFANVEELKEMCQKLFQAISPEFAGFFRKMRDLKLLDLDNRPGKAPGGYQCALEELRLPFIFMNSVGTVNDLFTLLHEGGHSFHQFLMAGQELLAYRDIPAEFAEVASMSTELLGLDKLGLVLPPDQVERVRVEQLEEILRLFCWIAQIDAFQHWIYVHPDQTARERSEEWQRLNDRFGAGEIVDWSGFEEFHACSWQRQLHLFETPFYYVEYGIAEMGALQMWRNSRKNPEKALADFRAGLSLGGSRPLPELFARSGLKFGLGGDTLFPLLDLVKENLDG